MFLLSFPSGGTSAVAAQGIRGLPHARSSSNSPASIASWLHSDRVGTMAGLVAHLGVDRVVAASTSGLLPTRCRLSLGCWTRCLVRPCEPQIFRSCETKLDKDIRRSRMHQPARSDVWLVLEGIFLDPTYTGRAFAGLIQLVKDKAITAGSKNRSSCTPVGLPGLFGHPELSTAAVSEQIDYPLSSPLDELSEWQRVRSTAARQCRRVLAVGGPIGWPSIRTTPGRCTATAITNCCGRSTVFSRSVLRETVYTVPSGVSPVDPVLCSPRGDSAQRHRIVRARGWVASDCDRVGSCGGLVHPSAARTSTRSPHPRRLDGRGASASRGVCHRPRRTCSATDFRMYRCRRRRWLRQIADQLVASPADTRSVEEWAADAKVSTRTLTRRFPAETGLTFLGMAYAIAGLITRCNFWHSVEASRLLARKTGFRSESAFGAAFRRTMGVTPGEFASLIDHPARSQ